MDIATERLGTVGKLEDGRSFVRFERRLPHSIDKVWAAITDPDELNRWFPEITLEQRQGGRYELRFGGDCDGPATLSGEVDVYDPPHVLQLGTIRWELEPDGGGCVLIFSDVLNFDSTLSELEVTHSVLGGWHRYLDQLEDALAGKRVDPNKPEPDYALLS